MKYVEKINKGTVICFLWVVFAMFCLVVSSKKEAFSQSTAKQPQVEDQQKEVPALGIDGPLQSVYKGKNITYTVAAINNTKEVFKDVVLTVQIPKGLQWHDLFPLSKGGTTRNGPLGIKWPFGNLEPGQTRLYSFEVLTESSGVYIITAELSTSSAQKPLNQASITTKVLAMPAMHISTYDTEDPVQVGKQTTYVIEIRNEGTVPCTNIKIESKIPEQMEFVSAAANVSFKNKGNTVTFDAVPILQPGEKLVYKVVCKVIKAGSARHAAILTYDEFDKPIIDEEGTSCYE